MDINPLDFDLPKHRSSAIKVVGVGGGGSNAVNYMKNQGIRGVDFIICNTDGQALAHSPVETKIQLGAALTEGLGAGANPEVGEQAAVESYAEIQAALGTQTKMVFITAGMGGGTGTGAAPIIAKAARELGILTVGIVTAPFAFEGNMRLRQAEQGIERLRDHVDSLIVINNNKLREVYGNLGFKQGFMKADEVLSTAARGIAEVITHHYSVNIDLRDAKTVLHNSGTAIMGSAKAAGSTRALTSVRSALDSPLLNDNHIDGARYVLLLIVSGTGEHEVTLDEIGEINDFIQEQAGRQVDIIMGIGEDAHLGDALQVTVIATGFSATNPIGTVKPAEPEKVVYELKPDSTPGSQFNLFDEPVRSSAPVEPATNLAEVPLTPQPDAPATVHVLDEVPAPHQAPEAAEPVSEWTEPVHAWEQPVAELETQPEVAAFDAQDAWEQPTTEALAEPEFATEAPIEMELEPEVSMEWTLEPAAEISLAEESLEEPVHAEVDEPAPTMTWTLDWDDNDPLAEGEDAVELSATEDVFEVPAAEVPAAEVSAPEMPHAAEPVRTVGLDELLAFEAQLRGEVAPAAGEAAEVAAEIPAEVAAETPADVAANLPTEVQAEVMTEVPAASTFEVPQAEAPTAPDAPDADVFAPAAELPQLDFVVATEAPVAPSVEDVFEAPVARFSAEPEVPQHEASPVRAQFAAPESSFRVEVRQPVAEREAAQIDPDRDSLEETMRRMAQERRAYLQAYSHRFGQAQQRVQGDLDRPAFERQGWNLDPSARYSAEQKHGEHMVRGEKNDLEFRPHNSFLHDNVD
ncbi:MAG: cell division protein FtsZ [Schleiferiaceae bacterium]